jgi:hypothetical protein
MPNHCNNVLTKEDKSPINSLFKKFLTKEKDPNGKLSDNNTLDAQKIIPMPTGIKKASKLAEEVFYEKDTEIKNKKQKQLEKLKQSNLQKYSAEDWYSWCIENWGTKWGCYDGHIGENYLLFCSAWAPPIPLIAELSKKVNSRLRLIYIEEGDGFCGEYIASPDGINIDNYFNEIEEAPSSLLSELGYEEPEDEY